jgi:hypothetical protein
MLDDSCANLFISRSQLLDLLNRTGAKHCRRHQHVIYLSQRNVKALLSKLDRRQVGEDTACAIVKHAQDDEDCPFNQSLPEVLVTAVENSAWRGRKYNFTLFNTDVLVVDDEAYYGAQGRAAGAMHERDEHLLEKPTTGVEPSFF